MKIKILLVDNSLIDVTFTLRALQGCEVEHEVTTACDGEEANRLIAERRVDLLLLDIKMPRINGLELLSRLSKGSAAHLRTIVVSGSALSSDREQADALGAVEYVHKTMEYAKYKSELKAALN